MTENEVAKVVVDACYKIFMELGPGLLESVYERALVYELRDRGLRVLNQMPIDIIYGDLSIPVAFVADIIVEDKVIVELKSVEKLAPVHSKQVLTYLRLNNMRLGLLINFGDPYIGSGIKRIANGLTE